MSLKRTLLAATIISSISGVASAQMPLPSLEPAPAFTGLYIGAGVGLNWLQNEHLINAIGTASNASLSTNVGYATVASVGWAMPNGIRVELEGAFRNNQFSSAHDFGFSARAGGREFKYGPMVNVLYDMTNFLADYTGLRIPYFAPYVGVGVGWQWSQLKGFTASANGGGPNGFFPSVASNDTYSAIAYQFILGGAMPIRSVPGLALTTEYRFFGVGSRKYDVTTQATAVSPIAFGTAKLGNDFNHSLMIGLRYNFNQPPPPPPAPAAVPGSGAGPLVSGVLRLGQGNADRSCPPDHRRSGNQLDQGAVHADRGERLYRYLGHAQVQPGPVDTPCQGGGGRTDQRRRAGKARSLSRASATRICWCQRVLVYVSRRTAASRSSSSNCWASGTC